MKISKAHEQYLRECIKKKFKHKPDGSYPIGWRAGIADVLVKKNNSYEITLSFTDGDKIYLDNI